MEEKSYQAAKWDDPLHRKMMAEAHARGGSRPGCRRTPEQRARMAAGCRASWAAKRRKPYERTPEGTAAIEAGKAAARLRRAVERARNNSTEE